MSVHEVIARLPGIAEVRRTSRALAMLDAVLSPEPEYRYYSFDPRRTAFRDDDGRLAVTVCFWRTSADGRWYCGPVEGGEKDGADWMFELLADGRPEAYRRFAARCYESVLEIDAIRHVYASKPLTEEIVAGLNPELTLADLQRDVAAIGYPSS